MQLCWDAFVVHLVRILFKWECVDAVVPGAENMEAGYFVYSEQKHFVGDLSA